MPNIKLKVPTLQQEWANCCWHTSALMIWRYWQAQGKGAGPMNTLADSYGASDTEGLQPQEFVTLGLTTGMVPLANKNYHSATDLHSYLYNRGPLWCAGYWWSETGHVVVLTGVAEGAVCVNDPADGTASTETIKWFNQNLAKGLNGCLMAKKKSSY